MSSGTRNGMVVLRQPGAVVVREFVPGVGPQVVRVELSGGVQPRIGADVNFELLRGALVLTGGG